MYFHRRMGARAVMKKRPIDRSKGLPDMTAQLRRILQDCKDYINSEYDVDKLCRGEFLERLAVPPPTLFFRLLKYSMG